MVAALLAGLWIRIEPKKRRQLLTILLLSRSLDSQKRLWLGRGITREIPHFNVMIWVLCAVLQQYTFCCEKDCVNPGVEKFLGKWGVPYQNDLLMQRALNNHAAERLRAGFFAPL